VHGKIACHVKNCLYWERKARPVPISSEWGEGFYQKINEIEAIQYLGEEKLVGKT